MRNRPGTLALGRQLASPYRLRSSGVNAEPEGIGAMGGYSQKPIRSVGQARRQEGHPPDRNSVLGKLCGQKLLKLLQLRSAFLVFGLAILTRRVTQ
jgi:hypothetical protein